MDKKTALKLIRDNEDEIWLPLYDYKIYAISNFGRIKAIERIISIGIRNGVEYFKTKPQLIIKLRTNGIDPHFFGDINIRDENGKKTTKTVHVHRAVCDHFVDKPDHIILYEKAGGRVCATHIVKDYENNRFDNVKWITQTELIQSQPNRKANPTKSWKTRREIYGSTGSKPDAKTGKVPRKTRKRKTK